MLGKFLGDLTVAGCKVQVGTENSVMASVVSLDEHDVAKYVERNPEKNLFFLGGVKDSPALGYKRASDGDIEKKNYFYLDFDIRKKHQNITDEEIRTDVAESIAASLTFSSSLPILAQWRYIVYTGNGLHVYYFGEPLKIADANAWRVGVKALVEAAGDATGEECDAACINPARIARLPGSKNRKSDPAKDVVIVKYEPEAVADLQLIEQNGAAELARMTEENKKKASEIAAQFPDKGDAYNTIEELPIGVVMCKLMGWEMHRDGVHFISPEDPKPKACFISKNGNYLIHGGTKHLPPSATGYRPFLLVKTLLTLDNHQTFQWFRDNFPAINAAFPPKVSVAHRIQGQQTAVTPIEQRSARDIFKSMQSKEDNVLSMSEELNEWKMVVRKKVTRIGAIFGTGKSKLGYFFVHMLLRRGYRGMVFSTEVDSEEVLSHLLCIPLKCKFSDIMEKRVQVNDAMLDEYNNVSIFDVTQTQNSLARMEQIIKKEYDRAQAGVSAKPDFIMIDYSQMVTTKTGSIQEPYLWARRYGAELQEIAQKYDIAIIDICQLGKEGMTDANEGHGYIPFEGGPPLNQSADVAIMLKRDKGLHAGEPPIIVDIRKSKPLSGQRVRLEMQYDWRGSTFRLTGVDKGDGMHDKSL